MACPLCGAQSRRSKTTKAKGLCANCAAKQYRKTEAGRQAARLAARRYQQTHKEQKKLYMRRWRLKQRELKQGGSWNEAGAGGAGG